jgi:uncharacterized glyoxalase superfamily protein PhnB
MIRACRYVIAVPDLNRSAQYYAGVLGFTVVSLADAGWCIFSRDACVIMAGECRDAIPPDKLGDHSYFAYLDVADARRMHDEVLANGAEIVKPLRDEPWGMREFGIRTLDGHRIMVGEAARSV